jgi:preprotein translocase subunit YajC
VTSNIILIICTPIIIAASIFDFFMMLKQKKLNQEFLDLIERNEKVNKAFNDGLEIMKKYSDLEKEQSR